MKIILITILLVLSSHCITVAQQIEITQASSKLGSEVVPAFNILVHNSNEKLVAREWQKTLKSYSAKPKFVKGEIHCIIIMPSVSTDTIQLLSKIQGDRNGNSLLTAAFNIKGDFITGQFFPAESQSVEKLLYNFALETRRLSADKEIKKAESELNRMFLTMENLVSRKESLIRGIERNKNKIRNAEDWIKESAIDRVNLTNKIEAQITSLSEAKNEKKIKSEQRRLDKLNKDRRNLDKKKDNLQKNIIKMNGQISDSERAIVQNEREQIAQEDKTEKQKKELEILKMNRQNIR